MISPGTAPRLSVIMPAYNAADYLAEAIQSILDQTFGDFELIVVDDASADGTEEIVAEFVRRDSRVTLVGARYRAVARASNAALALARGEYVARHDADDVSLPERFAAQVAFLDAHSDVGMVGTAIERFGSVTHALSFPTEHDAIRGHLLGGGYALQNGAIMGRREVWNQVGGYRPQFLMMEDVDFFLRVCEVTQVANLPEMLYRYRKPADAVTVRGQDLMGLYLRLALECAYERLEFGRDLFLDHLPGWSSRSAVTTAALAVEAS